MIAVGLFGSSRFSKLRHRRRNISIQSLLMANIVRLPAALAPLVIVLSEGSGKVALASGSFLVSGLTVGEILLSSSFAKLGDKNPRFALVLLLMPLGLLWAVFGAISERGVRSSNFLVLLLIVFLVGGLGAGLFGVTRNLVVGVKQKDLDSPSLHRLLGFDMVLMEVFFLMAPVIILVSIFLAGNSSVPWATVGVVIVGIVFALVRLSRHHSPVEKDFSTSQLIRLDRPMRSKSVWRNKKAAWVFSASAAMGICEGGLIISIPTLLVERNLSLRSAGIAVALVSAGSIVGGSLTTRFSTLVAKPRIRIRLGVMLLGLGIGVVAVSSTHSLTGTLVTVFVTGLFVAPLNTTRALAIEDLFTSDKMSEGFGALYGAYSVGFGVVGLMLGLFSGQISAAGILISLSFLAILVALFLIFFASSPKLSNDSRPV